jgi:hypothetical protein
LPISISYIEKSKSKIQKTAQRKQNKQHYQKKEKKKKGKKDGKKKIQERTTDKGQVIQGRTNRNEKEAD